MDIVQKTLLKLKTNPRDINDPLQTGGLGRQTHF